MKVLSRKELKNIKGGDEGELEVDDGAGKCKALGTSCSSNADCGGANNYCYCRLGGYGCM